MRILLVEDHPSFGPAIKEGLETNHYAVDLIDDGHDALACACTIPYDLVVLDVMLPGIDGFDICRRLREMNCTMPVLFLTARDALEQRIKGLNLGADDYLTKPFAFRELEARIRALLRRGSPVKSSRFHFLDIELDTTTHQVKRGTRKLNLSHKEFALLEFLLYHPHEAISRESIIEHLWNMSTSNASNVIDFYICSLRTKLCASGEPDIIQTVRGYGYRLKEPVA